MTRANRRPNCAISCGFVRRKSQVLAGFSRCAMESRLAVLKQAARCLRRSAQRRDSCLVAGRDEREAAALQRTTRKLSQAVRLGAAAALGSLPHLPESGASEAYKRAILAAGRHWRPRPAG